MKIVVTGASGFLGSALAARFLTAGHQVLALAREDPAGARTRGAIEAAARGLGISLTQESLRSLTVRELDYGRLASTLLASDFRDAEICWHSAAEMSYSGRKLEASFAQNLTASSQLYRWMATHAPQCQRFYYVSTAYTAGFEQTEGEVLEELHCGPRLLNVYQASKWAAETSLGLESQKTALPLCIFRPSVIIGDEFSGWNGGKDFGMYSIVRALFEARRRGIRSLTLPLNPKAKNNLIPINRVVATALALSERPNARESLEIFHACAASSYPLEQSLALTSELLKVQLSFGPTRSSLDQAIWSQMGQNRVFTGSTWEFSQTKLARALGPAFSRYDLEPAALQRSLSTYIQQLEERMKKSREPAMALSQTLNALMGWTHVLGVNIRFERPSLGALLDARSK